jgi:hypothetical protein
MSLANAVKVVAVSLLLVAFSRVITKIVKRTWRFLAKVPVEVYQAVFASSALLGLLGSPQFTPAHAFSVALFSSFAFLLTVRWIVESHPAIVRTAQRLKQRGWPVYTVLWHSGILYFGVLAMMHASRVFGLAAAVVYSAWNSFGVAYEPGVLTLGFVEGGGHLSQAVVGHLAVLVPFSAAQAARALPARLVVFEVGINYYLTLAFGVALLIGASPWRAAWDAEVESWADEAGHGRGARGAGSTRIAVTAQPVSSRSSSRIRTGGKGSRSGSGGAGARGAASGRSLPTWCSRWSRLCSP